VFHIAYQTTPERLTHLSFQCGGVRFRVGKMVELAYTDVAVQRSRTITNACFVLRIIQTSAATTLRWRHYAMSLSRDQGWMQQ